MVQHFKVTIFGDCLPVYDGKKSLYTANALRVASGGVRVRGGVHMLVLMDKNQSSAWKVVWTTVQVSFSSSSSSLPEFLSHVFNFRSIWTSPCQVMVGRTAPLKSPSGLCHWSAGTCCTKSWPDVPCPNQLTWRNPSAPTLFMLWTSFCVTCPPWSEFTHLAVCKEAREGSFLSVALVTCSSFLFYYYASF